MAKITLTKLSNGVWRGGPCAGGLFFEIRKDELGLYELYEMANEDDDRGFRLWGGIPRLRDARSELSSHIASLAP